MPAKRNDTNSGSVTIDGRHLELRNLGKVFFPASNLRKQDLVEYYRRVAPTALPHYQNRPVTLRRFPDGIGVDGFFQKDRPGHYPAWIESISLEKRNGRVDYVLVNNAATLVYLAEQACIELHLALATIDRPHYPDRLVFDLDPSDGSFEKVRVAAKRLKVLLDRLHLKSFVQTTGSRGLHVVVPLDGKANFDRVRRFARCAAEELVRLHPEELTTELHKARRGSAVFVDYLRNAYGQTAVAPYSVRALENAPVATPIRWDELSNAAMQARRYTIRNIFRRLGQVKDPWADMARHAQSLALAEKALGA
jgi:bifunctional non-homologous end joining protein LigD